MLRGSVFVRRGVPFVRERHHQGALSARGGAFVERGAASLSRGCIGGRREVEGEGGTMSSNGAKESKSKQMPP